MTVAIIISVITIIVLYILYINKVSDLSSTVKKDKDKTKKEEKTIEKTKETTSDGKKTEFKIKETLTEEKETTVEEEKLPKELQILELPPQELLEKTKIDIQKAMKEYEMDKETIIEMFKEFEEQMNKQKTIIYELLSEKKWDELEREMHSLKGAALNLKFETLGLSIKYIDDLLKKHEDLDNIKKYIDLLYSGKEKIFSKF